MNFHARTFELFGQPGLLFDPEREAEAVRSASALGVTLPPAVAEWYGVPVESELWRGYASSDAPVVWRIVGDNCMHHLDDEHDAYREWWIDQAIVHDPTGWVKGPILPLMCENQGTWWWGVSLDGKADPPVVITFNGGETWDTCADAFSSVVFSILFDRSLWKPAGIKRSIQLPELVSGVQRRALQTEFRAEPITRGLDCGPPTFTERFSRPGQRLHFYNHWWSFTSGWQLWAADAECYADLAERLCRIFPAMGGLLHEEKSSGVNIPF